MKKQKKEQKADIEKIEEDFLDLIRNRMTDKQFWNWVSRWLDADTIIEQAKNWDIEDKKELLKKYK